MERLIYSLSMLRSRKILVEKYGKEFWNSFSKRSNEKLAAILPLTPNIGNSIFSFNYQFGPAYIACYLTFFGIGTSPAGSMGSHLADERENGDDCTKVFASLYG